MSAALPGAQTPRTTDTATPGSGLRQTLRRLWQTAVVWTLLVAGATAWWAQHELTQHRQEALQSAARRLDNLQGAIDLSFQQLGALPGALGRQAEVATFLQAHRQDHPTPLDDAQRQRLREQAMQDPA